MASIPDNHIPLCVDLDGTLIKTDVLLESMLLLLKKNVIYSILMFFWCFGGIAYLKYQIAKRTELDVTTLPYHQKFLDYLKAEHAKKRQIYLVTAANKKIATQIANYLAIFKDVMASDIVNLKGKKKADKLVKMFGKNNYDYAGNSVDDLKVWSSARNAIVVNASQKTIKRCKKITRVKKVFKTKNISWKILFKALRIHQYAKNLLLFVALFTAHKFFNVSDVAQTIFGFLLFSLLASSVYLLNDLLDLQNDRSHHIKKNRPIAAGVFPIKYALVLIPCLIITSLLGSFFLPEPFQIILSIYFLLTNFYSFFLKEQLLLDVFTLSILYTVRILAGAFAIHVAISEWLLLFSVFFFLSLSFVKRYAEILNLSKKKENESIKGRAYKISDLQQVGLFGSVSGYISVFIFTLYIHSDTVKHLYHMPSLLWIVCLLLLYWMSRIWILAARGEVHEDPLLYAFRDKNSLFVFFLIIVTVFIASV